MDAANASLDVSKGRVVLPKNVKPIHYDLTLEPNLETFKYEGTVVIEFVYNCCGASRAEGLTLMSGSMLLRTPTLFP